VINAKPLTLCMRVAMHCMYRSHLVVVVVCLVVMQHHSTAATSLVTALVLMYVPCCVCNLESMLKQHMCACCSVLSMITLNIVLVSHATATANVPYKSS
jgi:uncharacterized membrane protein YobD (UPF0266 family)